jgi:hypothetical protein
MIIRYLYNKIKKKKKKKKKKIIRCGIWGPIGFLDTARSQAEADSG